MSRLTSDKDPQIKSRTISGVDRQDVVYFRVNVTELFGIDLSFKGIKSALNDAFREAKRYVPVDTGLTRDSMTMRPLNNYMVEVFFDPEKIIGKIRKGKKVEEYYVKYIAESAKNYNWLSSVIYHFYTTLYGKVRSLFKYKEEEQTKGDIAEFMAVLSASYFAKKKIAKEKQEAQKEKQQKFKEEIAEKKRLLRIKNSAIKDMKEV